MSYNDDDSGKTYGKQFDHQIERAVVFTEGLEIYRTPNGDYLVQVKRKRGWISFLLGSDEFIGWLQAAYYEKYKDVIAPNCVKALISILRKQADDTGNTRQVLTRVHRVGVKLYLDLGGKDGKVVEVTTDGWRVIDNPGIPFWCPPGMMPITCEPSPELTDPGFVVHYFETTWQLTYAEALLLVMWLVAVLVLAGPYIILEITGQPRCGRATQARILKALVDPNDCDLTQKPLHYRDLPLIATTCHLLAMAECTTLPPTMLDTIRQIATGVAWKRKRIYRDTEMYGCHVRKPVIVISSRPVTNRAFQMQRLLMKLQAPVRVRTSSDIWREFDELRSHLLAGLLTAAASVLANDGAVLATHLPGVPDFAHMVAAAAPAFGITPEEALRLYAEHIGEALPVGSDDSPLVLALVDLVEGLGGLTISATDLLETLRESYPDAAPSSPAVLGTELSGVALPLVAHDITFRRGKASGSGRDRLLIFEIAGSRQEEVPPIKEVGASPMMGQIPDRTFNPPDLDDTEPVRRTFNPPDLDGLPLPGIDLDDEEA